MRCVASVVGKPLFFESPSITYIPLKKVSLSFVQLQKQCFFPASFRDTVRYQEGVPSFGFEVNGISDGLEAKKSPGLQSKPNNISPPHPPPPPTHTQKKEKQTNRQKQKEKNPLLNETTLTQKILG